MKDVSPVSSFPFHVLQMPIPIDGKQIKSNNILTWLLELIGSDKKKYRNKLER